ncbi:unnamed protein product [Urochloa humidicola]
MERGKCRRRPLPLSARPSHRIVDCSSLLSRSLKQAAAARPLRQSSPLANSSTTIQRFALGIDLGPFPLSFPPSTTPHRFHCMAMLLPRSRGAEHIENPFGRLGTGSCWIKGEHARWRSASGARPRQPARAAERAHGGATREAAGVRCGARPRRPACAAVHPTAALACGGGAFGGAVLSPMAGGEGEIRCERKGMVVWPPYVIE